MELLPDHDDPSSERFTEVGNLSSWLTILTWVAHRPFPKAKVPSHWFQTRGSKPSTASALIHGQSF